MQRLRLRYLKGSKESSAGMGYDARMWDILEPSFPEYSHGIGRIPTFSRDSLLAFLKLKGYIVNDR